MFSKTDQFQSYFSKTDYSQNRYYNRDLTYHRFYRGKLWSGINLRSLEIASQMLSPNQLLLTSPILTLKSPAFLEVLEI